MTVWTVDELRGEAQAHRDAHDPGQQPDNQYDECAVCRYASHPCDTFWLASALLAVLEGDERTTIEVEA